MSGPQRPAIDSGELGDALRRYVEVARVRADQEVGVVIRAPRRSFGLACMLTALRWPCQRRT